VGSSTSGGNAIYWSGTTSRALNVGNVTAFSHAATEKSGIVRFSSMTLQSRSPFFAKVLNSAGGYTTYQIQPNKPTKISFSRETSVVGNPALYKAVDGDTSTIFVTFNAVEDPVDIKLNVVVDADKD
jgi:hypothetical protein